jgi:hypothetical protein
VTICHLKNKGAFMPNDALGEEIQNAVKGAADFIRSKQDDLQLRQYHVRNLESSEKRLSDDITERSTFHLTDLHDKETAEIEDAWNTLNRKPQFTDMTKELKAHQQTFETLRQINGGGYPRDISPVLYVIPLILLGVAEWYVNYATFAAVFIPVFAIAGTLIVAAAFAWASHMHGSYLKQISEIIHPSVEYRNVLGRKLALLISTILLVFAFVTIVWLRYDVIATQLGLGQNNLGGTFGTPGGEMVWSRLGPTRVLNVLIWGIGTLYSWAMNEKIPDLRESYRSMQRANSKVNRARRPVEADEARIKATFNRERVKNDLKIKEYRTLQDEVRALIQRNTQP